MTNARPDWVWNAYMAWRHSAAPADRDMFIGFPWYHDGITWSRTNADGVTLTVEECGVAKISRKRIR